MDLKPEAARTLLLPSIINSEILSEIKKQFDTALHAEAVIEIDGQQIEKISTSGIQLLISLINTANDIRAELQIINPSEKLIQKINLLGLDGTFKETYKDLK